MLSGTVLNITSQQEFYSILLQREQSEQPQQQLNNKTHELTLLHIELLLWRSMEFNNIPGPVGRLLCVWLAAFPLEGVIERMKTTEC